MTSQTSLGERRSRRSEGVEQPVAHDVDELCGNCVSAGVAGPGAGAGVSVGIRYGKPGSVGARGEQRWGQNGPLAGVRTRAGDRLSTGGRRGDEGPGEVVEEA